MKYRVIEDLEAAPAQRFVVQHSPFGHHWSKEPFCSEFADQISAEIEMERRAKGPRVIAEAED